MALVLVVAIGAAIYAPRWNETRQILVRQQARREMLARLRVGEDRVTWGEGARIDELHLFGWPLTPQLISGLEGLSLELLILDHTTFSDADARVLPKIHGLRRLSLSHTLVADDACTRIGSIGTLQALYLDNTSIGDAGLARLDGLRELKSLSLNGTKVSKEAVADFQAAHPHCSISNLSSSRK